MCVRCVYLGSNSCHGELTYFNAGLSIFFLPFLGLSVFFPHHAQWRRPSLWFYRLVINKLGTVRLGLRHCIFFLNVNATVYIFFPSHSC